MSADHEGRNGYPSSTEANDVRPFATIPTAVLARAGAAAGLAAMLAAHADTTSGECYPSVATLAALLGQSVSATQRQLTRLVALDLVEILKRGTGKTTTTYRVAWAAGYPQRAPEGSRKRDPRGRENATQNKTKEQISRKRAGNSRAADLGLALRPSPPHAYGRCPGANPCQACTQWVEIHRLGYDVDDAAVG